MIVNFPGSQTPAAAASDARMAKIRELSTGLVLARWACDAREIVGGGGFEHVPADTPLGLPEAPAPEPDE